MAIVDSNTPALGGQAFVSNNAGPIDQVTTTPGQENPAMDVEQAKYFDFNQARVHLKRIVDDWDVEVEDTDVRRKTRDVEIDTEGLRQKGDLDEDETIIPVRVIDTNIQREQPPYINYLQNSRRICTFKSLSNPDQDTQNLETEFTRGMTYAGWQNDIFKCLDGAMTHGWAAIEVVFDDTKPLNVGLEYVAHDELFWPRSIKKLQDAPHLIRKYDVTISKLREWIRTFGFETDQVEKLVAARKDTMKESETIKIYKHYFKKEGVVYVSWFSLEGGVDNWLKKPVQFDIGISEQAMNGEGLIPSAVKQYPIFLLPYRETEKPKVVDHRGRVFLDEPKQEGQTAILSGFVNGLTRAANVYASPDDEDGTGSSLKELEDVKLVGGRIMSKPMKWFSPPYPDPMIIRVMQYFDTANSEETNQVNFAAMNREDSRKTAKEIGAAQQQQQLLNTVQLTLFSTFVREVYSFVWLIVQSQAQEQLISFLLVQVVDQQQLMMAGQQIQQQTMQSVASAQLMGNPMAAQQAIMQSQQQQAQLQQNPPMKWTNDMQVLSQKFELRAAGDVDVVQRQEKIQLMMQTWGLIANTALAPMFLADLIKILFPDVGERYAAMIMQQQAQPQQVAAGLAQILDAAEKQHPEMLKTISPQEQQQMHQLIQQGMALGQQAQQGQQKQQPKQANG